MAEKSPLLVSLIAVALATAAAAASISDAPEGAPAWDYEEIEGVGEGCLGAVTEVDGCLKEALESVRSGNTNFITSRDCCVAVLSVADGCWPNIIPFLCRLKGFCYFFLADHPAAAAHGEDSPAPGGTGF